MTTTTQPELAFPPELIERLAERVADLVADRISAGPPLVSAEGLARLLGVKRSYVYEHASELGGVRLGDGPKARLRFDPTATVRRLSCSADRWPPEAKPARLSRKRGRPRASLDTDADLLPITGRREAA